MHTYIVTTMNPDGSLSKHTVQTDTSPTIVPGQGLTFSVGGAVQAPSPFLQWCACDEQG